MLINHTKFTFVIKINKNNFNNNTFLTIYILSTLKSEPPTTFIYSKLKYFKGQIGSPGAIGPIGPRGIRGEVSRYIYFT